MQLLSIETFKKLPNDERSVYRNELMGELQQIMDDAEPIRSRIEKGVTKLQSSLNVYDTDFENLLSHYCQIEDNMV